MSITNRVTSGITNKAFGSISRRVSSSSPSLSLSISSLGLQYDGNGGDLISDRSTVARFHDWEGIIRSGLSNEIRYEGGRRVHNLASTPIYSWSDLSGGAATDNGDGTTDVTGLSTFNHGVQLGLAVGSIDGRSFRYTVELKGEGANIGKKVKIIIKRGSGGAANENIQEIYLTDEFESYTLDVLTGVTSNSSVNIRILGAFSNNASECVARTAQLEEVTGQSVQTSGEMLPIGTVQNSGLELVKYFNYKPLPYDYVTVYGDSYTDESDELGSNLQQFMGMTWHTSGVAGESLSQIRARMVAEAPYLGTNLVLLEGGANDIFAGGADPNTAMREQMELMTAHAISNNLNYIVFTIPPNSLNSGDGYTEDMQTYLESYNAWVISNYPSNHVDMYSLLEDPASAGDLNPIYDEGDRLHSNAAAFRVVDRATEQLLNAIPRIDLDVSMQFMHEQAATNLLTDPIDATQAGWTHSENVAAYVGEVAPDGSSVSVSLTPSIVDTLHYTYDAFATTSGVKYTQSYYCKPNGYDWIQIVGVLGFSGTNFANYNVNTGVLGNSTGVSAADISIEKLASGWVRCSYRDSATATGSSAFGVFPLASDSATRAPSFAGNASDGIFIMHSQAEPENLSSFTSVVRDIDFANIPLSVGDNFNQELGMLIFRFTPKYDRADQVLNETLVSTNSGSSSLLFDAGAGAATQLRSYDGGSSTSKTISPLWSNGDDIVVGLIWNASTSGKHISYSGDGGVTWGSWTNGTYDGAFQVAADYTFMSSLTKSADLCVCNVYEEIILGNIEQTKNWIENNAGDISCATAQFP